MTNAEMLESDVRAAAQVPTQDSINGLMGEAVKQKFEELATAIEGQAYGQDLRNTELQAWAKRAAASARELGETAAAKFHAEAAATDALIEAIKSAKLNGDVK